MPRKAARTPKPKPPKLEVDQVHKISDGNGGALNAKIVELPPNWVHYKTRTGNKGRFGAMQACGIAKFRRLMRE